MLREIARSVSRVANRLSSTHVRGCPTLSRSLRQGGDFDFWATGLSTNTKPNRAPELLCRPAQHNLRAVRAPLRLDRNFTQTLRALFGRGCRRGLLLVHAREQPIHRHHDKEVDRRRNQQKRDDSIDKVAHEKIAAPNVVFKIRKVWQLHKSPDKWRQ